jgi:hypothetical protein
MKLGLVLTNDWELFGDGSGDFFEVQYDPTMKLLELFGKQKAKITLMAECMQQFAYRKMTDSKSKDIANAWENALNTAVSLKNDVQLHLHPQWINSEYKDDRWLLDMSKWSLASLQPDEISDLIKNGKDYLTSLLRKDDNNYDCIAYRAGSYCIQPSEKVIPALIENRIKCDTSVTKGLYAENLYDFRNAHSNISPWYIDIDVNKKAMNSSSIIEYPIYSINKLYSEALNKCSAKLNNRFLFGIDIPKDEIDWIKKRDALKEVRYPRQNRYYKKKERRTFSWYARKILSRSAIQLDYDYLPATLFVKLLTNLYNSKELDNYRSKNIIIPMIASGHIKDIPDLYNIEKILSILNNDHEDKIVFLTLTEAVNNFYQIEKEMKVLP